MHDDHNTRFIHILLNALPVSTTGGAAPIPLWTSSPAGLSMIHTIVLSPIIKRDRVQPKNYEQSVRFGNKNSEATELLELVESLCMCSIDIRHYDAPCPDHNSPP